MKLVLLNIRNFRLLRDTSISTNDAESVTVLVGPNNSGKTSVAEALMLFIGSTDKKFSAYDFSVSCRLEFENAQPPILAADSDEKFVEAVKNFPTIELDLHFEYGDTPADLTVASDLLMDLDEMQKRVALRIVFSPKDKVLLAKDYRTTRQADASLFDFLIENLNKYYGLAYYKLRPDGKEVSKLADGKVTARLLKIDFVFAQRHIDDQENSRATRLSHLLHAHYEKHYKDKKPDKHEEIEKSLKIHATDLGLKYMSAFEGLIQSLSRFGYAQRRAPSIAIRAELSAHTLFHDNTRIYYGTSLGDVADGGVKAKTEEKVAVEPVDKAPAKDVVQQSARELPEKYNGLGFKNLIYMVLQIQSFRVALERMPNDRPLVHLIFIEEPETHLHPHMQSVFIQEISTFLKGDGKGGDVQVAITSHSSHIISNSGFSPIRYFRRNANSVTVKDLLEFQTKTGGDVVRFLRRYLSFVGCDLFFADKAILVEGQVERLLLPQMIAQCANRTRKDFAKEYITIMEVGGAHAHQFEQLIKFLEIPTLVITDLDSIGKDRKKCPVKDGDSTSNATLKSWLPKLNKLVDLIAATPDKKLDGIIRVAYQVAEAAHPCGRSFEEAFIYCNAEWLLGQKAILTATGERFDHGDATKLRADAFNMSIEKVDFALDLMLADGWNTPKYIAEGLDWLSGREIAI